ncbi:hypothetical protein Tco_0145375 [Tanacetum coccineum]
MALPPRNQRHQYLRYEGLQYTDDDIADFKTRLARIYSREVHMVQVFDFGGLLDLMAEGLSVRMLIEHRNAQGVSLFSSQAWRRLFDIRGPLVHELILEFFRLHTDDEMQTLRFCAYWAKSARQIPDKGDMRDYWISISSAGVFLGTTPSYTAIRDPILRLYHRLIACSIAGRSQALEKSGALISGGQFVARLAKHFRLLTKERLRGLTVIAPELPIIDMAKLAPPPPPAVARTMPQRMARLEEDVYEIRRALAEQREVISAMAKDFSRSPTDGASTSTAQ